MAEVKEKKEKKSDMIPVVDPWTIVSHPVLTEKNISRIETENKLVFVVRSEANKKQIKWAVETALNVKVTDVNTLVDRDGVKKAMVRLAKEYKASDIATRFGML